MNGFSFMVGQIVRFRADEGAFGKRHCIIGRGMVEEVHGTAEMYWLRIADRILVVNAVELQAITPSSSESAAENAGA